MNTNNFDREYGSVYKYMSPTNMPGVRNHCGIPEAIHHVDDLDHPYCSYQTSSEFPAACGTLGPNWVAPDDLPIIKKRMLEGFHNDNAGNRRGSCPTSFRDLLITILVLCIIITLGMYLLNDKH